MIHFAQLVVVSLALVPMFAEPKPTATEQPALKEPEPAQPLAAGAVVYHTLTGRDAQIVFTSDAPLEKIVGKSNTVAGFAIPGPKDEPAKLQSATWVVSVKSLATGIPLRDEHLAGKDWLDAEAFPTILFVLTRVGDIKEIKRGEGFTTWSGTLVGNMTLHGVTLEVSVKDARLSFFAESPKTASIAPGDLMFLKCDYSVKLSDFGILNSDVPKKVSDTVTLSQMLRLSSASPETLQSAAKKRAAEDDAKTTNAAPETPKSKSAK